MPTAESRPTPAHKATLRNATTQELAGSATQLRSSNTTAAAAAVATTAAAAERSTRRCRRQRVYFLAFIGRTVRQEDERFAQKKRTAIFLKAAK